MKKFLSFLVHPVLLAVLGVLALSALVWWVGPLIGFGESQPFESVWVRLSIIGVFFGILILSLVIKAIKRKRANAALLEGIAKGPSASDKEAATPRDRFNRAVKVLQESGGGKRSVFQRGQFLYELPWYIFFGAPGSGKTTALLNAGLTFPLAEKLGQASV